MTTPTNSYMITNRADPTSVFGQAPLPGSELWWYLSPTPHEGSYRAFHPASDSPSSTPPGAFADAICAQLLTQEAPSLAVFIHGLDCFWTSAVEYTGLLATNLAANGYDGLVIGFSWPSNGKDDLLHYSNGYPPSATVGTVRGDLLSSVDSFGSLVTWTRQLAALVAAAGKSLDVHFICHSEGNFMLMHGLATQSAPAAQQILLLAADINDAAFQTPSGGLTGQAANVAAVADAVTVYFSTNDPVLSDSVKVYGEYHNPSYPLRLGLSGPSYPEPQSTNLVGLDCSAIVDTVYVASLPPGVVPSGTSLHVVYFYIPQVLSDMAQTLAGVAPGDIANRAPGTSPGAFSMTPVG